MRFLGFKYESNNFFHWETGAILSGTFDPNLRSIMEREKKAIKKYHLRNFSNYETFPLQSNIM